MHEGVNTHVGILFLRSVVSQPKVAVGILILYAVVRDRALGAAAVATG